MAIIHDKIEAEPQALTIHAGMAAGSMWPYHRPACRNHRDSTRSHQNYGDSRFEH